MSKATDSIVFERRRQHDKGFTEFHDDGLRDGSLAVCAAAIVLELPNCDSTGWVLQRAKHVIEKYAVRDALVVAASLLIAEIERLDRLHTANSLAQNR